MHIAILSYLYNQQNFIDTYSGLAKFDDFNISLVQRSKTNHTITNENLKVHYLQDEFEDNLLWWQNPEIVNEFVGSINPDIVHVLGLNLPLHFRWLKHDIPESTKILAEHTGEKTWAQKNLWLQQFGLRVVDGFIFQSNIDAKAWTKCSAILKRQSVYETIENSDFYLEKITNVYMDFKKDS